MRRISIDTFGMMSPRGTSFKLARRMRTPWYLSRPRLVTTFCLFAILYIYLNYGSIPVLIPENSYDLLKDESLVDILNSTLGVRANRVFSNPSSKSPHPFRLQRLSTLHSHFHSLSNKRPPSNRSQFPILTIPKFEKILVLNLPYRTDRRDAITLAAAASNLKLDFVNGVTGDSIRQSAYPPPSENIGLPPGIRGSWRTHMNALQKYFRTQAPPSSSVS